MSECRFVPVPADAVDWLKKNYPALCEKSGLCERVGGVLYTRTTLATPRPPVSVEVSEETILALARKWRDWTSANIMPLKFSEANMVSFAHELIGVALSLVEVSSQTESAGRDEPCEHCDGTGDVNGYDGEWRGYCECPAGVRLHRDALLKIVTSHQPQPENTGKGEAS